MKMITKRQLKKCGVLLFSAFLTYFVEPHFTALTPESQLFFAKWLGFSRVGGGLLAHIFKFSNCFLFKLNHS